MSQDEKSDPTQRSNTKRSRKSKPKLARQISIDDISIHLKSTSLPKKKKKKKSRPSTPNPSRSARKKRNKKAASNALNTIKKNSKTKSSNKLSPSKSPKEYKHGRERSQSDLGLAALQMRNSQPQIKAKDKSKSKKHKSIQKHRPTTPIPRSKKRQSNKKSSQKRSRSKSSAKTFNKSATDRSSSISKSSLSVKQSRARSKSSNKLKINNKKQNNDKPAQKRDKPTNKKPKITPIKVVNVSPPVSPDDTKTNENYDSNKTWPEPPVVEVDSNEDKSPPTKPRMFSPPSLGHTSDESTPRPEDRPVKIDTKPNSKKQTNKQQSKSLKKTKIKKLNTDKFKKAEIRSKSNRKNNATKRKNSTVKKDRPETPVDSRRNEIERKYGGVSTPKTPIRNSVRWGSKKGDNNRNKQQAKEAEAQQHLEYIKMQKLYRLLKKDLKKMKSDSKALEIEKRRIKKDQQKLLRDKEQFEIDTRTANLKRDNDTGKKKGKYTVLEEDKLRKMLYAERKQWNEERKNLRSEIMRLQSELGTVRHGDNKRISTLKNDIMTGLNLGNDNHLSVKNVGPKEKHDYSRQQKEFSRFIRIEKQRAMNDIQVEKKKLAMLAKQLRADHDRLKKKMAVQRNTKWSPRKRQMNHKVYVDQRVKKIYIDPKHRRPYGRNGDKITYKPKQTRIVYRDLRKRIVLRTHEWDTKIKYLNHKGKELNHIKRRIVTLEEKIDKKKYDKRKKKKNKRKKNKRKKKGNKDEQVSVFFLSSDDDSNDDGSDDDMAMEKDTDEMREADTELAQALEELDELQSEYISIEQDIEQTVDELQNDDEPYEQQKEDIEKLQDEKPALRFELKGSNHYLTPKKQEMDLNLERDNNYRTPKKPDLQFELKKSNNYKNVNTQNNDLEAQGTNTFRTPKINETDFKKQATNTFRTAKDNEMDLTLGRDNNFRTKKQQEYETSMLVIQKNPHMDHNKEMSDTEFELQLQKIQQSEMRKGNVSDAFELETLERNRSEQETKADIDMEAALAQIEKSPSPGPNIIHNTLQLSMVSDEMDGPNTKDSMKDSEDNFEMELTKLENALTINHHPIFEQQVSKMENIITEQAEEAGTLRQVIEDLSERLANSQLEIDNLKEHIRACKRRQKLRDLYMRMAYSDLPEYKFMQSADEVGYYNRKPSNIHENQSSNSYLTVNNQPYVNGNSINNRNVGGKKRNKRGKFSESGLRVTASNNNSTEWYAKSGMRINAAQKPQDAFGDSGMKVVHNEVNSMSSVLSGSKSNVKIVDNDGMEVMDIDKAMNILFNPSDYSPSALIKASKAVYANGLIDDRREYMSGNNIVNALLDIIQYNGKLAENPDNLQIVKGALKALVPLLDDGKCRSDFFKKDGIDIFDNLFGPNMDSLKHMYPISGLIANAVVKVSDYASDNDKLKMDDIIVKLCHILHKTHKRDKGKKLLPHFGGLLEKIDAENEDNLMKALIDAGILDISTSCAFANASDHLGVSDTFGLAYDHVANVDSFLHNNANVSIDELIDAIDLYSTHNSADVLGNVLDGVLAMILCDPNSQELIKTFKDKGLEHVLIRALNNAKMSCNTSSMDEEKYDEHGNSSYEKEKYDNNNAIMESISDFYNTLQFEKLKPKMSQLKAKLNSFGIALYGTQEWIDYENPTKITSKPNMFSPLSSQGQILEDLYAESKYEFDESDAIEKVKKRRHKRSRHPKLRDMGAFLSRIGEPYSREMEEKDEYNTQQMIIMNKTMNDKKEEKNKNNNESKMSKLFSGMFGNKKKKEKESKDFRSEKSVVQLKLDRFDSVHDVISPSQKSMSEQGMFVQNNNNNKNNNKNNNNNNKPNRMRQQERMFLSKYDKNGRKRVPKYDDFMNEAFNNEIGRGLNEVQKIYNEMTHHTGLVKPVGSMLQKWYVLANHGVTYWVSPTNEELSRYSDEHDDYYDMDDDEKYYDCWLLYDMKRKRMVQEIRWRNRGHMNDAKYITIQCANDEETPWRDISNAYLEKTDDEQIIKVNKKSRYWRILFLGNHGEDTDEAPRFVFYEVQFWGRRHSTMNYSRAATARKRGRTNTNSNLLNVNHGKNGREDSVSISKSKSKSKSNTKSKSHTFSKSNTINSRNRYKQYKIGYGDNAKKGKRYKTKSNSSKLNIEMTGKSKFTTVPL